MVSKKTWLDLREERERVCSKRGEIGKRRKGPRECIGTKKPRELVAKMAELYWNQKLREGKQSPGLELKRFSVGCKVTSAGRSHEGDLAWVSLELHISYDAKVDWST